MTVLFLCSPSSFALQVPEDLVAAANAAAKAEEDDEDAMEA